MDIWSGSGSAAVIVAHPDDETLWAGGTILSQPAWNWFILSLCRGSDPDRAPRFFKTLKSLGADGRMCDLDDGPEQVPLDKDKLAETILKNLPANRFDRIVTHSPAGEYTRHRRHEEVGEALISLWYEGKIFTDELWTFAYQDGNKSYLPQPVKSAHIYQALPHEIWNQKYDLITKTYGFEEPGFEARTTPRAEAFWRFIDPVEAQRWLTEKVFQNESSIAL